MRTLKRHAAVALIIALLLPVVISCGSEESPPAEAVSLEAIQPSISHDDLKAQIAKYAQVKMDYPEDILSTPEKNALVKLVEAGYIMDEIFLRQVWTGNVEMRDNLKAAMKQAHDDPKSQAATQRKLVEDVDHANRCAVVALGDLSRRPASFELLEARLDRGPE